MFHVGCSTGRAGWDEGGRRDDPALADACGWYRGRAQLALRRSAADRAAETQPDDRGASPAVLGKLVEGRFAPAVAVVAVEPEGMLVGEEVGDGVQVDGVHARSVARGGLKA